MLRCSNRKGKGEAVDWELTTLEEGYNEAGKIVS